MQKRIVSYAHDQGKPVTSNEIHPAIASASTASSICAAPAGAVFARERHRPRLQTSSTCDEVGVTLTPAIGIRAAGNVRAEQDAALRSAPSLFLLPIVALLADPAGRRTLR